MASCKERLERARANPRGVRFSDLCALATCHGWVFDRLAGSHRIYKRIGHARLMNFQDHDGMAIAYQVRQLLRAIDALSGEDE